MTQNPSSIKSKSYLTFLVLIFIFGQGGKFVTAQEDLSVVKGWMKYTDLPNALYNHLSSQAFDYLQIRVEAVQALQTRTDWLNRQKSVRAAFLKLVGPFPEKTPLNAKILGTVLKKNFRLEKIVYESIPGFYVTAGLFIPAGLKGKSPAIIFCSGHSEIAFRCQTYQTMILNLVKKGFIVLAFDPVGQGERLEYFDPLTGETRTGPTTLEHSYPGAQCFISGSSEARYMIWDGIRSVDYLLTRPEVDLARIGITGRSGGGTQSAYIAAFDERILATAPEAYITSFRRLFESRGPQDAEQNFYHGIANQLDHADLLEVRAPKPALLITTTRDFFSIQGARETAAEVRRAYQALGTPENFSQVEDDHGHGSTPKNRAEMYAFFQQHLNLPGESRDEPVEYLTRAELQVTPTGQISTALGSKTIFQLNRAEIEIIIARREQARKANLEKYLAQVKTTAQKLSGYQPPTTSGEVVFTGRYQKDDYVVEKYFIPGEGNYIIPFIFLHPKDGNRWPAMIYLHPRGKAADAGVGREMEWLVKNGYAVLAPDLIGTGELGPGIFRGDAYNFKLGKASYNIWFASIQIGRSLAGLQAGDVVRLVNYLKQRNDIDSANISALSKREMCSTLLHAAAFCPDISRIALIEPYLSYRSIVTNQYYKPHFVPTTVAGALTAYDLPDLAACLAPRNLLLINITDQNGKSAGSSLIEKELGVVRSAYSAKSSEAGFEIQRLEFSRTFSDIFEVWLAKE